MRFQYCPQSPLRLCQLVFPLLEREVLLAAASWLCFEIRVEVTVVVVADVE